MKKSHQLEQDDYQQSDRCKVRNEITYPAVRRLLALAFVCATTLLLCEAVSAQQSSVIEITDPKISSSSQTLLAQGAVDLTFAVSSTDITKVRVMVLSAVDAAINDMDIDPEKRQQSVTVNLFKGANKITLIGFKDGQPDSSISAYIDVTCNGRKCGASKTVTSAESKEAPPGTSSGQINIKQPHKGDRFKNVTYVDSKILVPKSIKRLLIKVSNDNKDVKQEFDAFDLEGDADKELNPKIRIGKGKNEIMVFNAAKPSEFASVELFCDGEECGKAQDGPNKTAYTRGILGFDQSAAASASPAQKMFLEFNLSAPLFRKGGSPLDAPVWLWLNPRITSLPQQVSTSVGEFSTSSNFFNPVLTGKVNDIVQGFEFLGGVEIPLKLNGARVTAPIASGYGPDKRVRFGLSVIVGAGAITPFNPQRTIDVFKINQTVRNRFPHIEPGKEYIAFVSPDRTRFFRQYFGGLRLKSYFVRRDSPGSEEFNDLDPIFPGILELTFGQNESVTRGRFRGGIARIEGIYPLPFVTGDKSGAIYVFGSALMKLTRTQITDPIFLDPPGATVPVPGENVHIEVIPQIDRDYYRLGIGVDLIRLLRRNNK